MAFVLVILALATVVTVVVIRQVFSLAQTRMSSSAEESYRSLAEEAVAAQARGGGTRKHLGDPRRLADAGLLDGADDAGGRLMRHEPS
jgi:hypothetical protein